ncbi:hypothetical protein FA13DRAFT_1706123 [Coprinellus micaceus]|uniref:Uncharacterized protein n=1 Tax=Coprinellus micaceus TaxID=71717 RepID=A0A4Y7TRY3_COPMI|nr:hypothetical protein FA13DRAFT_1706123 [Coprinellus micaceus]
MALGDALEDLVEGKGMAKRKFKPACSPSSPADQKRASGTATPDFGFPAASSLRPRPGFASSSYPCKAIAPICPRPERPPRTHTRSLSAAPQFTIDTIPPQFPLALPLRYVREIAGAPPCSTGWTRSPSVRDLDQPLLDTVVRWGALCDSRRQTGKRGGGIWEGLRGKLRPEVETTTRSETPTDSSKLSTEACQDVPLTKTSLRYHFPLFSLPPTVNSNLIGTGYDGVASLPRPTPASRISVASPLTSEPRLLDVRPAHTNCTLPNAPYPTRRWSGEARRVDHSAPCRPGVARESGSCQERRGLANILDLRTTFRVRAQWPPPFPTNFDYLPRLPGNLDPPCLTPRTRPQETQDSDCRNGTSTNTSLHDSFPSSHYRQPSSPAQQPWHTTPEDLSFCPPSHPASPPPLYPANYTSRTFAHPGCAVPNAPYPLQSTRRNGRWLCSLQSRCGESLGVVVLESRKGGSGGGGGGGGGCKWIVTWRPAASCGTPDLPATPWTRRRSEFADGIPSENTAAPAFPGASRPSLFPVFPDECRLPMSHRRSSRARFPSQMPCPLRCLHDTGILRYFHTPGSMSDRFTPTSACWTILTSIPEPLHPDVKSLSSLPPTDHRHDVRSPRGKTSTRTLTPGHFVCSRRLPGQCMLLALPPAPFQPFVPERKDAHGSRMLYAYPDPLALVLIAGSRRVVDAVVVVAWHWSLRRGELVDDLHARKSEVIGGMGKQSSLTNARIHRWKRLLGATISTRVMCHQSIPLLEDPCGTTVLLVLVGAGGRVG